MAIRLKYKVGDTVQFQFAGMVETGNILSIDKEDKNSPYRIYDGKYYYGANDTTIKKKLKK